MSSKVLMVEDSPAVAASFAAALSGITEVHHVLTFTEGLAAVRNDGFAAVILDLTLPETSGVSTLEQWALGDSPRLPTVVCSGNDDPSVAALCRLLGYVFLLKGNIMRRDLLAAIGEAVLITKSKP